MENFTYFPQLASSLHDFVVFHPICCGSELCQPTANRVKLWVLPRSICRWHGWPLSLARVASSDRPLQAQRLPTGKHSRRCGRWGLQRKSHQLLRVGAGASCSGTMLASKKCSCSFLSNLKWRFPRRTSSSRIKLSIANGLNELNLLRHHPFPGMKPKYNQNTADAERLLLSGVNC